MPPFALGEGRRDIMSNKKSRTSNPALNFDFLRKF